MYGRDRVSGVVAESFAHAVQIMKKEVEMVTVQVDLTYNDDEKANSVTQTVSRNTRNSKKQKKASLEIENS